MSNHVTPRSSDAILAIARRVLLLILLLGMLGILVELLLVEHFEDAWQFAPLVLLTLGLVVIPWHARAPGRVSTRALRALMSLFLVAGLLGIFLHYRGNREFELEQTPNASEWELFREAVMGGTPALAPGVMIQLGLLGLLFGYLPAPARLADGRRRVPEKA